MNHDSFFVYGILLKYSVPVKIVVHMRTMLPVNAYARFQAKVIAGFSDHMIFITENELKRFWELVHPVPPCYSIVFNAAERPEESSLKPKRNGLPSKGFKVLFLGNLTYHKGADRLIKIAKALKMAKVADILFVVCGMDRQRGWSMGKRSMALEAELQGVLEYFLFLGHQPEPAPFLRETDILIRLSRGNDPWGRDIIEALTYGKPVIAIGTYDTFVQNGVNGFLLVEFSATETAKRIVFLAEHPQVVERMRVANIEKAKKLFDGRTNGGKVAAIYDSIMKSSCEFQGRCSA